MGNFKVYTTFNKSLGQTAPSAWKRLKTQFWAPLTNWKFEPSSKAHTHSDSIINKHTEKVKILPKGLSWHVLNSMLQKNSITLKSKDLATRGFQKKIHTQPPKPAKAEPSSERSAYPLQNYVHMLPRSPLG